jgi:hypothetical protein
MSFSIDCEQPILWSESLEECSETNSAPCQRLIAAIETLRVGSIEPMDRVDGASRQIEKVSPTIESLSGLDLSSSSQIDQPLNESDDLTIESTRPMSWIDGLCIGSTKPMNAIEKPRALVDGTSNAIEGRLITHANEHDDLEKVSRATEGGPQSPTSR